MPSTAEEVAVLAVNEASYFSGSLKYGFDTFKDFFFMIYYTTNLLLKCIDFI
jgi:hypothetical protein